MYSKCTGFDTITDTSKTSDKVVECEDCEKRFHASCAKFEHNHGHESLFFIAYTNGTKSLFHFNRNI